MSRAFIKETDDMAEDLPDRLVSPHPNLVTPEGLAMIHRRLEAAAKDYQDAQSSNNRAALARAARELRYWQSRRSTAQVVRAPKTSSEVGFGHTVTILRQDGREQIFRIVGEDEADPAQNLISYVSPVARALFGKRPGDILRVGKWDAEIKKFG